MKSPTLFITILMGASFFSGMKTYLKQSERYQQWKTTALPKRHEMIFGVYAETVKKINVTLKVDESFVLSAPGVDTALLAYALFPRKIWQLQVETEFMESIMELQPSPYPRLTLEHYRGMKHIVLRPETLAQGGVLE